MSGMDTRADSPLLEARSLTAALEGDAGSVTVLDAVSLSVAPGEVVDVNGASGCGKTTLLRALARLLPDVAGELLLDGTSAQNIAPSEWRAAVALLPQKPAIVTGTVRDNLLLPWTLRIRQDEPVPNDAALLDAMAGFGLSQIALARGADRMSVGQQARVALLRVLLTSPRVLLLDEPDANLDDVSADLVGDALSRFVAQGGAAIRVRHQRTDALATRRLSMCGGTLTELSR
jgi:putative ABC transport system ATP-binding protein